MNAESIVVDQEVVSPEDITMEEVSEAPVEDKADDIPEKFRGKSAAEIAGMYSNLESELGRKQNEVGELRSLTDEILKRDLQKQNETQVEAEEAPDFFDDPEAAVQRIIDKNPTLQQVQEQARVQSQEANKQKFAQAHPDFMDVVQDSKFQEWIQQSPVRTRLFQTANANYDFDAGNELLTNWKERQLISKTQEVEEAKETKRKAGLKAGKGVSKASGESTAGKKIYRRADLIRLKQTDPNHYDDLAEEIMQAYAEGRVK